PHRGARRPPGPRGGGHAGGALRLRRRDGHGARRSHHRRQDDHRAHAPGRPFGRAVTLPVEAEDMLLWLSAERGRAPNTLAAYRRDLERFGSWLAERGTPVLAVTE